jgi:hypothetical protein
LRVDFYGEFGATAMGKVRYLPAQFDI